MRCSIIAAIGVTTALSLTAGWTDDGDDVLALTGWQAQPVEGAAAFAVRTALVNAEPADLSLGPGAKEAPVLAVEVRIEDPTHPDRYAFAANSALIDSLGKRVAKLIGPERIRVEWPRMLPTGEAESPSVCHAHLLFEVPPPEAEEPLTLDLRLLRIRDKLLTFVWHDVGPASPLPLPQRQAGIEVALSKVEVATEAAGDTPARPHLIIRAAVTYPIEDWEEMKPEFALTLSEGETVRQSATIGYRDYRILRAESGEATDRSVEMSWHFPELAEVPVPADVTVEVRVPHLMPEPFIHALPTAIAAR